MNVKAEVISYIKILIGSALTAITLPLFLLPNNVVLGGIGGITVILYRLFALPPGLMMLLINAPIFLLAFFHLGRAFLIKASVGVLLSSVLIQVLTPLNFPATADPFLVTVYSGILIGIGAGLILSTGSSGGGVDILARVIRKKYPNFSIGQLILIFDFCVVLTGALVFGRWDNAMYAMLTIFIIIKIIDAILYGINYAKVVHIISEHGDAIGERIVQEMVRGVTILRGVGGYSGREKSVLICAIKQKQQITEIKRIVYSVDPDAFIIIHEAREVLGRGFMNADES